MKRFLITISAVLITLSGFSITVTREYVDRQDAETLQAAKDYADQHGGGGGVVEEADPIFAAWLAMNPLSRFLTSESDPAFTAWLSTDPLGGFATTVEVDKANSSANEAKATANEAKTYSVATYNFMNGNTNAWFAGTNYVFGADATNKHHFAFEDGMDIPSMPCSMALWENRDCIRKNVWDQRDWVSWYWSFKAGQMRREIAATNAEIRAAMTNYAPRAWSKMTAATGLENPDRSTTWIDTKNVTLSPGMAWETVATVDGCGYWTIVGNGAVIGGSGTNAVLTIRDFEGNDIMTVTKGEHRLAWLESSDFTGQSMDANNWVCFDMRADVQPTGYYSTTLEMADFVPETDAGCPAQYRWENMGGGVWRVHFLLKQGIVSASCFAKFQVEVEGQTIIRYNAGQEISGGLIYNGVKIAPDVSGHPSVGTVIQWKVVN